MTVTVGEVTRLDLDLEKMFDLKMFIDAAETEDEIGCLLRVHLMTEQLLDFYIAEKSRGETRTYTTASTFGPKLGLAVAFGFPLPLAASSYQLNKIRNDVAHRKTDTVSKDQVKQFGRCVNRISEIDENFSPVERRYIQVPKRHGERQVRYGESDAHTDFLLAAMAFLGVAQRWIAMDAIGRHLQQPGIDGG